MFGITKECDALILGSLREKPPVDPCIDPEEIVPPPRHQAPAATEPAAPSEKVSEETPQKAAKSPSLFGLLRGAVSSVKGLLCPF